MIVKEGGTLSDIYVTGLKMDYLGNIKVDANTSAIEADPNTWIKAGSAALDLTGDGITVSAGRGLILVS